MAPSADDPARRREERAAEMSPFPYDNGINTVTGAKRVKARVLNGEDLRAHQAADAVAARVRAERDARHAAAAEKGLNDFEDRVAGRFNYGQKSTHEKLRDYRRGNNSRESQEAYRATAGHLVLPDSPGLKEAVGLIERRGPCGGRKRDGLRLRVQRGLDDAG